MYDFWFTLGASIMNPGFLEKAVKDVPPYFNHITRVVTEIQSDGTTCTMSNTVSAGLIEKCNAKKFRLALRAGIMRLAKRGKIPAPPPTSFYTVGRLSQMITTPNLHFLGYKGNLVKAQKAYRKAGGHHLKRHSAGFPAFLGLCIIDNILRIMHNPGAPMSKALTIKRNCPAQVDNCPNTPQSDRRELKEILAEFRISQNPKSAERMVLTEFIALTDGVCGSLLGAVGDPWEFGCPDWIGYWSPQSDRVVS